MVRGDGLCRRDGADADPPTPRTGGDLTIHESVVERRDGDGAGSAYTHWNGHGDAIREVSIPWWVRARRRAGRRLTISARRSNPNSRRLAFLTVAHSRLRIQMGDLGLHSWR